MLILTDHNGRTYVFNQAEEKLLFDSLEKHNVAVAQLMSAIIETRSRKLEKLASIAKLSEDHFLFAGLCKTDYLRKVDQEYEERIAALLKMIQKEMRDHLSDPEIGEHTSNTR